MARAERRWAAAALALVGCAGDPPATPEPCADAESCDGADNDCDGAVDEGVLRTFHLDADGDGFGAYLGEPMCEAEAGYIAAGGDCDDGDDGVHPEAVEACDGADEDCDGVVDEGARTAWYDDLDGDGYGAPGTAVEACAAPEGFVAQGDDCDDGAVLVHPEAEEVCNAVDDDCDGVADETSPLASGWTYSLCAAGLMPDISLAAGIEVRSWPVGGPWIYEEEVIQGLNDTLATAQPITLAGTPVSIYGALGSAGSNGAEYTGDLDNYAFVAPAEGTLTVRLAGASADGLELLLYDERTEVYEGPVSASAGLSRQVSADAPYVLTVASAGDEPSAYQLRLTIEGPDAPVAAHTLWYSGSNFRDGEHLGLATSADGLSWANIGPILHASDCLDAGAEALAAPTVAISAGVYHLYFQMKADGQAPWIGQATSADGVSFECGSAPALRPEGDGEGGGIGAPSVRIDTSGTWWMWYERAPACAQGDCPFQSIGAATSADGASWTRVASGILAPGSRPAWASGDLLGHQVIRGTTGWQLYLSIGSDRGAASVGEALSGDGLSWVLGSGPILQPADSPQGVPRLLSPAAAIQPGGGPIYLWFLGDTSAARLGLAWKGD